jgi:hypothetical protein
VWLRLGTASPVFLATAPRCRVRASLPSSSHAALWRALVATASSISSRTRRRSSQYAALAGYVLAQSIILVPLVYIANQVAPGVICIAALVTFTGFAGLPHLERDQRTQITRRSASTLVVSLKPLRKSTDHASVPTLVELQYGSETTSGNAVMSTAGALRVSSTSVCSSTADGSRKPVPAAAQ